MYSEEERLRYYQEYVEDYQKSMDRMMHLRATPKKFGLDEQHYILTK